MASLLIPAPSGVTVGCADVLGVGVAVLGFVTGAPQLGAQQALLMSWCTSVPPALNPIGAHVLHSDSFGCVVGNLVVVGLALCAFWNVGLLCSARRIKQPALLSLAGGGCLLVQSFGLGFTVPSMRMLWDDDEKWYWGLLFGLLYGGCSAAVVVCIHRRIGSATTLRFGHPTRLRAALFSSRYWVSATREQSDGVRLWHPVVCQYRDDKVVPALSAACVFQFGTGMVHCVIPLQQGTCACSRAGCTVMSVAWAAFVTGSRPHLSARNDFLVVVVLLLQASGCAVQAIGFFSAYRAVRPLLAESAVACADLSTACADVADGLLLAALLVLVLKGVCDIAENVVMERSGGFSRIENAQWGPDDEGRSASPAALLTAVPQTGGAAADGRVGKAAAVSPPRRARQRDREAPASPRRARFTCPAPDDGVDMTPRLPVTPR